jgi:hypothetical protein
MKVIRIDIDSNIYQSIFPDVSDEMVLLYSEFDCNELKSVWQEVEWYVFNPKRKKGNFFSLGHGGAFAFDEMVKNSSLFSLLEMAGEIIEIRVKSEKYFILNVLNCIDALNEKLSTYHYYNNGNKGRILKYSFYQERITECPIFKIPQTSKSEILLRYPFSDDDDFINIYRRQKFTGLEFIEI